MNELGTGSQSEIMVGTTPKIAVVKFSRLPVICDSRMI